MTKPTMMKCDRCPRMIKIKPNLKFCDTCKAIVKEEKRVARNVYRANLRLSLKGVHVKPVKVERAAKIILSDEQQLEINKAIDNKHNFKLECRTIKPGDPDFDKIAATVVPPENIRFGISADRPVFFAEADPAKLYRRHETHSEARG